MTNKSTSVVFRYQRDMLEWLTSLDDKSGITSGMEHHIRTEHLYRLDTYQSSYLGRITANLAETVFDPCSKIFGMDFVCRVLAGHFKSCPPDSPALTSAADQLPHILRKTKWSPESLLFADLCEICIKRWALLISADPQADVSGTDLSILDRVFLKLDVEFIPPCSRHDLSGAWLLSQQEQNSTLPATLFESVSGVLLCKSSATEFHLIDVPESLLAFGSALAQRQSVASAVDSLEAHLSTATLTDTADEVSFTLQSLIERLASLGAFCGHA